MIKRKCIFHVPFFIDRNWPSGTNIRPIKLIEGLEKCGYDVSVVSGYGKDRKAKIEEIKNEIENGVEYDFVYSESSTEPTLLTEKNHIPKYPFLDFSFLKYLKKKGLKVGLFYRDIYWRFPIYDSVPFAKRMVAKCFYRYDLRKYKEILDILYLPHRKMMDYSPISMGEVEMVELPPAIDGFKNTKEELPKEKLKVFYVGGISGLYDMTELFSAFSRFKDGELIVCCRESEWKANSERYKKYMNGNIKVIHKSGEDKDSYIKGCHVCSLIFEKSKYREFAMPLKLFEYMSFGKPMISTFGTATGDYIQKHNLGWQVNNKGDEILEKLKELYSNFDSIQDKNINVERDMKNNTWDKRAEKIIRDLI